MTHSNWRTIGDTTLETYISELKRFRSPMVLHAESIYQSAKPHSALILAKMFHEGKYETLHDIPAHFHNPCSLAKPQGGVGLDRWERYGSFSEGVKACVDRITSPIYKGGVYAKTTTLSDLIHVFAPPSENDTEHYIEVVEGLIAGWSRQTGEPVSTLNMTKGRVGLPDVAGDYVEAIAQAKPQGVGWDNLGKRTVKGVSLHRQQGTNKGTTIHFLNPTVGALTDYGVDHVTGELYQWADPQGFMSGWASGVYNGAYGDGLAFAQKYGVDAINRDRASIELSGYFRQPRDGSVSGDGPITEAAMLTMARITAHHAHDYGIPWDVFPIAPWDGFSFVVWHEEFTRGTGKNCPGQRMMNMTAQLIEMARALMKAAQTGGPIAVPDTKYAAPLKLDTHAWDGTDRELSDGTKLWAMRRQVTARTKTPRYQKASKSSPKIGPDMNRGEKAGIIYIARKGNGPRWYVTEFDTRLEASDFTPYVAITEPKPKKEG